MTKTPIFGTPNDDTTTGTAGNDLFYVWQGGTDSVSGLDGDDIANFAGAFTAADSFDGGTGNDVLRLKGGYEALQLGATSLTSVEQVQLGAGHSYDLVSDDANVAAGALFTVNAVALGIQDNAIFNGSAETDGRFDFVGGAGFNSFTGGAGNDFFNMRLGGGANLEGGAGRDTFYLADNFHEQNTTIDGGTGNDVVVLNGDGANDGLSLGATTLTSVEEIKLAPGFDYDIHTDDATVAAGARLLVNGVNLDNSTQLHFDGSAETDGHFRIVAGDGDDTIVGGNLSDVIDLSQGGGDDDVTGGLGADRFLLGSGSDFGNNVTFHYNSAAESTGTHYDTIVEANFASDTFVMPWGTVDNSSISVTGGEADHATFNTDMAFDASTLGSHGGLIVEIGKGDLNGHAFLVIDVNGVAGYQAGADVVIDITGYNDPFLQ